MRDANFRMGIEDEFVKKLLDKLVINVISCLPVIESISNEQNEKIKECIGVNNMHDFALGALWCTILEKFLVSSYLYTGKTITYEDCLEISEYILKRIKISLPK